MVPKDPPPEVAHAEILDMSCGGIGLPVFVYEVINSIGPVCQNSGAMEVCEPQISLY